MSNLIGMAEAERQVRVARRLYELTGRKKTWDKSPGQRPGTFLSLEERRPFIDQSCQGKLADDDGYGP
jgi:hypothetical protein